MKELIVLLLPVYWSVKNDLATFNRVFYRKMIFYASSGLFFMFLATRLLNAGMMKLRGLSPEVFTILLIKGYSLIFIIIFFAQVINGFVMSLDRYYRSGDMELLLTSPVNRLSLFFSRLIETHLKTSWMPVVFGMPLLISLGLQFKAGPVYYLYSSVLFIVFSTIPVTIGTGMTMLISGIFNIKTVRKFIVSAGIISVLVMVVLIRISRPERFVNPELFANLKLFLVGLQTPSYTLLPTRWLSESLFGFLGGSYRDLPIYISLLLLTSYITTFILAMIYGKYHYRGWSLLQGGATDLKRRREGASSVSEKIVNSKPLRKIFSCVDIQKTAVFRKDVLYQMRDIRNIQQHLVLISLVIVYLFSIASLPMDWVGYVYNIKYFVLFFNLGLIMIIIASLCSRLVFQGFVSEGNTLWIIKSSPVSPAKFLQVKFLLLFMPVLFAGLLLSVFSLFFIDIENVLIAFIIVTIALVSFSLVSMALSFGVSDLIKKIRQDEGEEEIKTGNTAYMITSILFILFILLLEIIPLYVFFLKESVKIEFIRTTWFLIGGIVLIIIAVNVLVTCLLMRSTIKRFDGIQLC